MVHAMVTVTTQCVFCVFSGLSALIWPPSSTALLGTWGVRAGLLGWPAVWPVSVPTSLRARL